MSKQKHQEQIKYKLKDVLSDVDNGTTIFIHKYQIIGESKYIIGTDNIDEKLLNSNIITIHGKHGGASCEYNANLYIVE